MKTKLLKLGMPVMAFLLAVVFAFAFTPSPELETALSPVNGYIFQNGKCEIVKRCSTQPGPLCMHNGQVLRTQINQTQCGSQLFEWVN